MNSRNTKEAPSRLEMVIEPRRGWVSIDWRELLRYRELLYFLVWRDYKVRYKQTVLGVAWAIIQPVFQMVIFTFIFGRLANLESDGYPYAVFVYAGLLPWTYFSSSVNISGMSLVNHRNLLTKIYFPRLFVPTASIGAGLVDLVISFLIYACILAGYSLLSSAYCFQASVGLLMIPVLVLLLMVSALGVGYLLSAITVTYRDFRYVIPFALQAMMYLSPVVYSVNLFPPRYRLVVALNPMTGIIDGFRSAILGKEWSWDILGVSALVALSLFVLGAACFRRMEGRFADIA